MIKELTIKKQVFATIIFILVVVSGLLLPPVMGMPQYKQSVESIMFFAAVIVSIYIILFTNKTWNDIFKSATKSIQDAVPGILIMLVIGPLIAGFIMSGLIPMLIYYGILLINPILIYTMSLLLPIVFSVFTGMSWGSIATIGIVMIGVGSAIGADLGIVAGAVISGAYFGDKISPISASTNVTAMACKVELYDHVGSMVWTTGPATLIGLVVYTICGFVFPPANANINTPEITALLSDLSGMFNFNIFLLIPLFIVLYGSVRKKPAIPVLIIAVAVSFILTGIFQNFEIYEILKAFNSGFKLNMVDWYEYSQPVQGEIYILSYFERGGFWNFGNTVVIIITILFSVGVLKTIDAIPATMGTIFRKCNTRASVIVSSVFTGFFLIATTANGSACSFLEYEIWGAKYDQFNIDRRVLSRTAEDTGTLLEIFMPWTPAGIFVTTTLGVSVSEFGIWTIVNWITPLIAIILGLTGIGTYKKLSEQKLAEKAINSQETI